MDVHSDSDVVISTVLLPSLMVLFNIIICLIIRPHWCWQARLNRGAVGGQIGDDPEPEGLVNKEPVNSSFVFVLRRILRQVVVIITKNPFKGSHRLKKTLDFTKNFHKMVTPPPSMVFVKSLFRFVSIRLFSSMSSC